MQYLYGEFTDEQINKTVISMHSDIHKLLLYKDRNITEQIFNSEEDFVNYFTNLLFRFGGLNELLGEPKEMVSLMSTLQGAYREIRNPKKYKFWRFRRAILNCHGYIKAMFEEVDDNAEFINS